MTFSLEINSNSVTILLCSHSVSTAQPGIVHPFYSAPSMNCTSVTIDLLDLRVSSPTIDALLVEFLTCQARTAALEKVECSMSEYDAAAAAESLAFWNACEAVCAAHKVKSAACLDAAVARL